MAAAGFLTAFGVMVVVLFAMFNESLYALGWRGGEYATLFLVVTFASLVGGAFLRTRPEWRSFGKGLIVAGVAGLVIMVGAMFLAGYAFSKWNSVS